MILSELLIIGVAMFGVSPWSLFFLFMTMPFDFALLCILIWALRRRR